MYPVICAWCDEVIHHQGKIENSHGICQSCAQEALNEDEKDPPDIGEKGGNMPTKKMTITLDVELIEALKKEMKITRRSMANLINHLLFEALEKIKHERREMEWALGKHSKNE